tara:strand:+ start:1688 stop:2212 length:525 start_codon:yes stop_codon:yes gene_type:complete
MSVDYFSVAEVKKRGPERHIGPGYNFAGPGTEFRARMKGSDFYENMMKKAGRKPVGTKPYNKPKDNLDKCGVEHDRVYARKNATAAEVKEADRVFQKCAQEVDYKKDGIPTKLRSIAARAGFEGKIAIESLGLVRKGSFAEGGDKHSTLGKALHSAVGLGKKFIRGKRKGLKLR